MSNPPRAQTPHPTNTRRGVLFGSTAPFFVLAIVCTVLRLYRRVITRQFGVDDVFLALSVVCCVVGYVCLIIAVIHGYGKHMVNLSPPDIKSTLMWAEFLEPTWVCATYLIKLSLSTTLLRFNAARPWRIGIYVFIFTTTVYFVGLSAATLLRCVPYRALWAPDTPGARCWSPDKVRPLIVASSAYIIFSDIVLAVLPLSFIRLLDISQKQKIALSVLMGLGIMAIGASLAKLLVFEHDWGRFEDFTYTSAKITVLVWVEVYIAIIATCLPALRTFINAKVSRVMNSLRSRVQTVSTENGQSVILGTLTGRGGERTCSTKQNSSPDRDENKPVERS